MISTLFEANLLLQTQILLKFSDEKVRAISDEIGTLFQKGVIRKVKHYIGDLSTRYLSENTEQEDSALF